MPNFQTIVLDTATPQLRAPGTGDGYSFNSGATNLGVWTTTGLGIGTSSPSNGAKLDAAGAIISTAATLSSFNANNAGFDFIAASKIGRFFATSTDTTGGTMTFTTGQNGTYQTRMTILNDGNVGIGTSSPAVRLHVQGSAGQIMRVTDGTTGASIYSGGGLFGFNNQTGEDGMFGSTASHFLYFATNGSERARIDSSGNFGLGVTPSAWGTVGAFQLKANAALFGFGNSTYLTQNHVYDGSTSKYITTGYSQLYEQNRSLGIHAWYNAPSGTAGNTISFTQAMTLDASGNLGLGVTPSAWNSSVKAFQVGSRTSIYQDSANNAVFSFNNFQDATNNKYLTTAPASLYALLNNGNHAWYTAPSGTAGNAISFTQAMTLDASARLFVNTTTGVGNEQTLIAFNSAGTFSQGMNFRDTNASASAANYIVFRRSDDTYIGNLRRNGTDNALLINGNSYLALGSGDTERARIPAAGGFVVGTAALATTATDGFLYIPGCAGTPTGVPTALTGRVPLVVDTTNNKLYFYSGGAWRDAGP